MASIRDAYVEAEKGWVLTQDRYLVLDSLAHVSFVHKHKIEQRLRWPEVRPVAGRVMVPYTHWARDNYFHWMVEALPRLYPILTDAAYDDVRIVVPEEAPHWMLDTLRRLSVEPARLLFAGKEQLHVEELVFVGRTGKPCFVRDDLATWLAQQLGRDTEANLNSASPYLYVSRGRVPKRSFSRRAVVNEEEVVACLSEYGFQRIFLEELSLDEQIVLFKEARIVVAPHGAGLTNVLFASKATVVELFEPTYVIPLYYVLAAQMGHHYWFMLHETANEGDMVVDTTRLRQLIGKIQEDGSFCL